MPGVLAVELVPPLDVEGVGLAVEARLGRDLVGIGCHGHGHGGPPFGDEVGELQANVAVGGDVDLGPVLHGRGDPPEVSFGTQKVRSLQITRLQIAKHCLH